MSMNVMRKTSTIATKMQNAPTLMDHILANVNQASLIVVMGRKEPAQVRELSFLNSFLDTDKDCALKVPKIEFEQLRVVPRYTF